MITESNTPGYTNHYSAQQFTWLNSCFKALCWKLIMLIMLSNCSFFSAFHCRTAGWWSLCGRVGTTAMLNTFRPGLGWWCGVMQSWGHEPWKITALCLMNTPAHGGNKWSLNTHRYQERKEKERVNKRKLDQWQSQRLKKHWAECGLLDYRILSTYGIEIQTADSKSGKINWIVWTQRTILLEITPKLKVRKPQIWTGFSQLVKHQQTIYVFWFVTYIWLSIWCKGWSVQISFSLPVQRCKRKCCSPA